jgi:DNA-binding transcriptional MerR regulator
METPLPPIPPKRYFTIGEVSELCQVKPYVLRYWEQEFAQLKPMKRRGNRRYYQHHEVLLIRRIRDLLYEQGFTISGARNRLADAPAASSAEAEQPGEFPEFGHPDGSASVDGPLSSPQPSTSMGTAPDPEDLVTPIGLDPAGTGPTTAMIRRELKAIRRLLDA